MIIIASDVEISYAGKLYSVADIMDAFADQPQSRCIVPEPVEITIEGTWEPGATEIVTDLILRRELGEHYKN